MILHASMELTLNEAVEMIDDNEIGGREEGSDQSNDESIPAKDNKRREKQELNALEADAKAGLNVDHTKVTIRQAEEIARAEKNEENDALRPSRTKMYRANKKKDPAAWKAFTQKRQEQYKRASAEKRKDPIAYAHWRRKVQERQNALRAERRKDATSHAECKRIANGRRKELWAERRAADPGAFEDDRRRANDRRNAARAKRRARANVAGLNGR